MVRRFFKAYGKKAASSEKKICKFLPRLMVIHFTLCSSSVSVSLSLGFDNHLARFICDIYSAYLNIVKSVKTPL
jgi:hypothetical protein